MSPNTTRNRLFLVASLALVALLVSAACNDDKKTPSATSTPAATNTPAASGTPPDVSGVPELQDGKLTIGSDIAYAPIEFFQPGTEIADGLDVDLAKAIGEYLGIEIEFVNGGFDGLIAALNTDEYDAIMSAMTINEERSQQVDFVPYLNVGTGILVEAGNPNGIEGLEDLCGLTVAVQVGTIQETMVRTQSDACTDAIDVVVFDTNPLAVEDLKTGGADANLADYPVAYLDAQESDAALEVLTVQLDPAPYGIALRKTSTELAAILEQALQAIVSSGQYQQILADWDLESTALPRD